MKIILIRHGKPDIPSWGKLKASELHQWIESYNSVGIKKESQPPREAAEAVSNCNAVVCSDLLRSIESAKALGIKKVHYTELYLGKWGYLMPDGHFQNFHQILGLECNPSPAPDTCRPPLCAAGLFAMKERQSGQRW